MNISFSIRHLLAVGALILLFILLLLLIGNYTLGSIKIGPFELELIPPAEKSANRANPLPSAGSDTASVPPNPETLIIGRSVHNQPIEAFKFGNGPNNIVFVGGMHAGAAPGTVEVARQNVTHFSQNPEQIPDQVTLYVITSLNPDSPYAPGEVAGRLNAQNVDLNRNWGCHWKKDAQIRDQTVPGSGGDGPLSAPANSSLARFLLSVEPAAVLFWHARVPDGMVSPGNCEGTSLASAQLATLYSAAAGYPVADYEEAFDLTLTGDATDWLDKSGIPSISILLPDYTNSDWTNNLNGVRAILNEYAN